MAKTDALNSKDKREIHPSVEMAGLDAVARGNSKEGLTTPDGAARERDFDSHDRADAKSPAALESGSPVVTAPRSRDGGSANDARVAAMIEAVKAGRGAALTAVINGESFETPDGKIDTSLKETDSGPAHDVTVVVGVATTPGRGGGGEG